LESLEPAGCRLVDCPLRSAPCDRGLGADPTPGWRKHLEISYAKDGRKKKLSVDEDKNVDPIELAR